MSSKGTVSRFNVNVYRVNKTGTWLISLKIDSIDARNDMFIELGNDSKLVEKMQVEEFFGPVYVVSLERLGQRVITEPISICYPGFLVSIDVERPFWDRDEVSSFRRDKFHLFL